MFEKTVMNALASPELVGDLRSYSRQLRTASRQFGLITILIIVFLILQCIGFVYSPGSPSANSSDTIYGGISNLQALTLTFDDKHSGFSNLARKLQISERDIKNAVANTTSIQFHKPMVIWSPSPTYSPKGDQAFPPDPTFSIKTANKVYYGYLLSGDTYKVPANAGWIIPSQSNAIILKQTGNIITSWEQAQQVSFCYKNPEQMSLSYVYCPNGQKVRTHIEANNLTLKTNASYMKSQPGDKLEYSLITNNASDSPITLTPQINISDILEYATLETYSGAVFSKEDNSLSWPQTVVPPHSTVTQSFVIKVLNTIPLTPRGTDNSNSYDCALSTYYGSNKTTFIRCPSLKITERLLHFPPNHAIFLTTWIGFFITLYIFARNKMLYRESVIILHYLRRKHD